MCPEARLAKQVKDAGRDAWQRHASGRGRRHAKRHARHPGGRGFGLGRLAVTRLGLFAYGSLVSPASAATTLGHPVAASGVVRLPGRRRRWSTRRDNLGSEKTFARSSDGTRPAHVLGLNLEPCDDDAEAPNGVVLEVSEADLERLDLREMRYVRFAIGAVPAGVDCDELYAYRAREQHFASRPPEDAIVIASYAGFVEAAFEALGEGERERYLETTGRPPVEVAEAVLVTDRSIPPGNPRDW